MYQYCQKTGIVASALMNLDMRMSQYTKKQTRTRTYLGIKGYKQIQKILLLALLVLIGIYNSPQMQFEESPSLYPANATFNRKSTAYCGWSGGNTPNLGEKKWLLNQN